MNCTGITALVAVALSCSALSAHAATTSGLIIKSMQQTPEGILVGFTATPAGCTTTYEGYHAIVRTGTPGLNNAMAVLVQRRATKQPLTLTYDVTGVCDKMETLLNVREAK